MSDRRTVMLAGFSMPMSRGYRLFFLACGCLIFAGVSGFWLQPEQPDLLGDRGYQEQPTSYEAGGAECEPAALNRLVGQQAQRRKDVCSEALEKHREAADSLLEVRRSAITAEASTVLAYKQTGIAAWEASVGLLTLFAAVGAAIFAERAAFHTKRSADLTESAQRPWISIECIPRFLKRNGDIISCECEIVFRNIGKMAAFSVNRYQISSITYPIVELNQSYSDFFANHKIADKTSLMPNEYISRYEYLTDKYRDPGTTVFIFVVCYYKSSIETKDWHETERLFLISRKMESLADEFIPIDIMDGDIMNNLIVKQLEAGKTI